MKIDDLIAAANRAKGRPELGSAEPEMRIVPIEELVGMVGRLHQAQPEEPVVSADCDTSCEQPGWSPVGVYCVQFSSGPALEEPDEDTPSGARWSMQAVRCISDSVLRTFHTEDLQRTLQAKDLSTMPGPLPLLEARRLAAICARRIASTNRASKEVTTYWSEAKEELEDYISRWIGQEEKAKRATLRIRRSR